MNNNPEEFKKVLVEIQNFIENKANTIVRVEGVKHFKKSFQDEGFTDETLEPWQDISEKRKEQKQRKNGDLPPILTETGDLGRSINGEERADGVLFYTDKVYAQRHNEGLSGMPKRQFMGPSKALEKKIITKFNKSFDKIIKGR